MMLKRPFRGGDSKDLTPVERLKLERKIRKRKLKLKKNIWKVFAYSIILLSSLIISYQILPPVELEESVNLLFQPPSNSSANPSIPSSEAANSLVVEDSIDEGVSSSNEIIIAQPQDPTNLKKEVEPNEQLAPPSEVQKIISDGNNEQNILHLEVSKKDFFGDEDVELKIVSKEKNEGIFGAIKNFFTGKSNEVGARLLNNSDQIIEEFKIDPLTTGEATLKIESSKLKPGVYKFQVTDPKSGNTVTQDFSWGVLALNTNKDIYSPSETSKISIAVLDSFGEMVCGARLSLKITTPSKNIEELTSDNGRIRVNEICNKYEYSLSPDFEAEYNLSELGSYSLELTAETDSGKFTIQRGVEVREIIPFEIERISATRIYPPLIYPMTIKVKANEDFDGEITETIPTEFSVQTVSSQSDSVVPNTDLSVSNKIQWKVNFKAGEMYEFGYKFKAPEISPEYYTTGTLQIGEYKELRDWQIAVDNVATKLRSEINITNTNLSATNAVISSEAKVLLDTTKFSGTLTYYFEVVASATASSTGNIRLRRSGTTTDDATIALSSVGTALTRYRSASFSPPAGATEYFLYVDAAGASKTVSINSARIIIIQDTTGMPVMTESQIEIGNRETGKTNTSDSPLNNPKYWNYTSANWDPIPTFYAEVTYKKTDTALATPTYIGKSAFESGNGNLSVGVPSGYQAGDLLVIFVESENQDISTPAGGWQQVGTAQGTGTAAALGAVRLEVFYKFATSSESSVTIADSGDHTAAIMALFRGVDSTSPINVVNGSVDAAATSNLSWPAVTTTVENTLVINAVGLDKDANDTDTLTGTWTNANLASLTERHDQTIATGDGGGLAFATGAKSTAGGTGNTTVTADSSTTHAYLTFAIKGVVNTTPAVTIKLQEDNGSFSGWADKITIVNAATNASSATRVRSSAFTPTSGRNYRIVSSISTSTGTSYDIYNAKIIAYTNNSSILASYPESNYDFVLNFSSSTTAVGQSFQPSSSALLTSVTFYLNRFGSPTGNLYAKLYAHSGTYGTSSVPTGTVLATSDAVDSSTLNDSLTLVEFNFTDLQRYSLVSGTSYVITLEFTNGQTMNNLSYALDDTSPTHGGNFLNNFNGVWTPYSGRDLIFYINNSLPISKIEKEYLIANTSVGASSGLKDFDSRWDPAEWTGVTNTYYHESYGVSSGTADVKLQSSPNSSPVDVTNSSIIDVVERERSSSITMPASASDIDLNVTGTGTLNGSKIIVNVTQIANTTPSTPTIVADYIHDKTKFSNAVPQIRFSSTDAESNSLVYQIEWANDISFSAPTTKTSDSDAGFSNITTPADTSPFNSGNIIEYLFQSALTDQTTVFYRVRAKDPSGTNTYSSWSSTRSFTLDSTDETISWFETHHDQFGTDTLTGSAVVDEASNSITLSSGSQIDAADGNAANWVSSDPSGLSSTDESTVKQEGTGSVKLNAAPNYSGTGADGSVSISGSTVININSDILAAGRSYADGIAYRVNPPSDNASSVSAYDILDNISNGIAVGDEVLLINMQGTYSDNSDVGNYEFLKVASISSTTITFTKPITKSYDGNNVEYQKVIVQRVPNYSNMTISDTAGLITGAWDGLSTTPTGSAGYQTGILAFRVSGTLTNTSTGTSISVNAKGYRGGTGGVNDGSYNGGENGESYDEINGRGSSGPFTGSYGGGYSGQNPTSSPNNGGVRGGGGGGGSTGSSAGTNTGGGGGAGGGHGGGGGGGGSGSNSTSSAGNGGSGGGTGVSAGGGAGARSSGTGAAGGNAGSAGGTATGTGGQAGSGSTGGSGGGGGNWGSGTGAGGGGGGTYGSSDLGKLYLGSGGGGGGNRPGLAGKNGGNGGGIIFIGADTISSSGSNIISTGGVGAGGVNDGGSGGGGAGGSILIRATSITVPTGGILATGGSGGDSSDVNAGGGGDGGVGRIRIEASSITGTSSPAASTSSTPARSNNDVVVRTISSLDLSSANQISFYVRSNRSGSFARFEFGESNSDENTCSFSISTKNTWEQKTCTISGITGTARDAITKLGFRVTNDDEDFIIYLDNITYSTSSNGTITSSPITVANIRSIAAKWSELKFNDDETAGDIKYQVLYDNAGTPTLIPEENLAGNATGFDESPVDLSGLLTSTYPVLYVRATLSNVEGAPILNDWNVTMTGIFISGVVFNKDTSTPFSGCDGSTTNIAIRAGGETLNVPCHASTGEWSSTEITSSLTDGEGIVVWIDGHTTDGALVSRYDGTGNSNNNMFYTNTVTVTSDDTNPVSVTIMDTYDSGNDTDIPYSVTSSSLTVNSDFKLLVKIKPSVATGSTVFDPNGPVKTQGSSGDLHIDDNLSAFIDSSVSEFSGDIIIDNGSTLTITTGIIVGGGDILTNGTATLNASSSTVILYGSGTVGGGANSISMNSLLLHSTGTTVLASDLNISTDLTVGNGNSRILDIETNDNNVDVNGSIEVSDNATLTISSTASLTVASSLKLNTLAVLNEGTGTITFDGAMGTGSSANTITTNCSDVNACTSQDFYNVVINKSTSSNYINLAGNFKINNTLTITTGILFQGQYNIRTDGSTAITVDTGGTLNNTSTGDLVIGGSVSNSGLMFFKANNTCGGTDSISITSTVSTTQRAWSGAGTFHMYDVSVSDQGGTASITVYSGTNVSGNGANWTFDSSCPNGIDLTQDSSTIQIDVPNQYRAIIVKGNSTSFITFYDRAQDDLTPDASYRYNGPYIKEAGSEYHLKYDDTRKTEIIEVSALRVKIRVSGCFSLDTGSTCLTDSTNRLSVVEEYTFSFEGMSVQNKTDFKNGIALDNTNVDDGYGWLSFDADLTVGSYSGKYYGNANSETTVSGSTTFSNTNKYFAFVGSGTYQTGMINIARIGWIDNYSSGTHDWSYRNNFSGNLDRIQTRARNYTPTGTSQISWRFILLPSLSSDTSGERKSYFTDYSNPDMISPSLGSIWRELESGNTGLKFDGSDDVVEVSDNVNGSLDPSNEVTVEAWVKFDQLPSSKGEDEKILVKQHSSTPFLTYTLEVTTEDRIRFGWVGGTTTYYGYSATSTIKTTGRWYHVAGVKTGTQIKVYLDGKDVTSFSDTTSGTLLNGDAALKIGATSSSSKRLKGVLDELRVWNVARTQTEIAENMSALVSPTTSGLAGYWQMDENTDQSIYDLTTNNNNGTLGTTTGSDSSDPKWIRGTISDGFNFSESIYSISADSSNETVFDFDGGSNPTSTLSSSASNKASTLSVTSTSNFGTSGVAFVDGDKFTYTGSTSNSFTGIPNSGFDSVIGHLSSSEVSSPSRIKPHFKVRSYRSNNLPVTISLEGSTLTQNTDYKTSFKPVSDAYFVQDLTWSSSFDSAASVTTSPDVGNTGTVSGSITFVEGKYGKAAYIDASGETLTWPSTNVNMAKGAIEFWMKTDWNHTDNLNHYIFSDTTGAFGFRKESNNQLRLIVSQSVGFPDLKIDPANYTINAGTWYHIRFEWDDSAAYTEQFRVFIDGTEPAHTDNSIDDFNSSLVTLGSDVFFGTFGNVPGVVIDEPKVYNLSGSNAGIKQISKAGESDNSGEYLNRGDVNQTFSFAPVDSNKRGEFLYLSSDSMVSGYNFDFHTNGTSAGSLNLNWEYWDGNNWTSLENAAGFSDTTNNFTQDGAISWDGGAIVMHPYSVNGSADLYYIRAYLANSSATYSTAPIENKVLTDTYFLNYLSTISSEDSTFTFSNSVSEPPDSPVSLAQKKVDDSIIAIGAWVNTESIKFSANATDPESTDTLYLCIESKPVGVNFDDVEDSCGDGVAYSGSAVSLIHTITVHSDSEYHWQARIKDSTGNYSSWVQFGGNNESESDYGVDDTAPSGGTVYDGTGEGVDTTFNDGSLSTLSANWGNIDSDISGLQKYEYSIGTTAGATDIKTWTDISTNTSVTATGLTLNSSQTYYFNVRTTDNAGNNAVISSNGQLVSPSLSFSISTNTVTFANLNSGNEYTDTKTTTLTTSTNAYNGYVIKLFKTDSLRSAGNTSNIIPDFGGGSYSSPASWNENDYGFGYTSSDTTIQGIDKFNNNPCPGGGTPSCYAPFPSIGPGDIVADHTATVTGTPIINEQFIVTYKVKTSSSQPAGPYSTSLVYTVVPQY